MIGHDSRWSKHYYEQSGLSLLSDDVCWRRLMTERKKFVKTLSLLLIFKSYCHAFEAIKLGEIMSYRHGEKSFINERPQNVLPLISVIIFIFTLWIIDNVNNNFHGNSQLVIQNFIALLNWGTQSGVWKPAALYFCVLEVTRIWLSTLSTPKWIESRTFVKI